MGKDVQLLPIDSTAMTLPSCPSVREATSPESFMWCWADAQMLPGMHALAEANPLRWSGGVDAKTLAAELGTVEDQARSVQLRPAHLQWRRGSDKTFENAAAAVEWLRHSVVTSSEPDGERSELCIS